MSLSREEIIRMAREAGFTWEPINNIIGPLEHFANAVYAAGAAAEREACAKLEYEPGIYGKHDMAEAIRARNGGGK